MPAFRLGGMSFRPNRMMTRAAGRWGAVRGAGLMGGARMMGGAVGAGAWKGAAIGAGVGAGMSVINDAANGNFNGGSVGRALVGGLGGGALGGLGGAGFGAGNFFVGRSPAVMARSARMAASRVARARAATPMGRLRTFGTRTMDRALRFNARSAGWLGSDRIGRASDRFLRWNARTASWFERR